MKFSNTEIENLASLLKNNNLATISYEQDGCVITLSTNNTVTPKSSMEIASEQPVNDNERPIAVDNDSYEVIKCPLVGHFYLTQTPDSEPYVTVGSKVECGEVIGILQAMKVSNEIKSHIAGEIVEILAENGQFVDYDAPLFKVRVK